MVINCSANDRRNSGRCFIRTYPYIAHNTNSSIHDYDSYNGRLFLVSHASIEIFIPNGKNMLEL